MNIIMLTIYIPNIKYLNQQFYPKLVVKRGGLPQFRNLFNLPENLCEDKIGIQCQNRQIMEKVHYFHCYNTYTCHCHIIMIELLN